ncbi:DNA-binding transcriptional regulator YdaS (Cro superfamily) [Streptomyces canus]|uniref:DNA-binding transcriptional regulator YdaS (Cro superfamily) n=1 Tax=Streptomyces canus TaxID=58343 RepID=A0AAW8F6J3_9ACTN|nr:XRE family transcriptional regulator [Streptomyces canus]MDQ0904745.1 DNA-binding transcriptional regulator YdaS (Cro superfamily) [Streptomyces canus]
MAGEIGDAIERADRESFTRQPPKTLKGQIGYLIKQLGSAKAVAQEIGVTADSVNRYRRGARKHARKDVAAKIDDAVRQRWQPQVRKRRQRKAATTGGITVETRARFGYTAPVGTTDDGRFRRLTVHLPPRSTPAASSSPRSGSQRRAACAQITTITGTPPDPVVLARWLEQRAAVEDLARSPLMHFF